MHRAGLLPTDYAALGIPEQVGRKFLAAAVQRGEQDLRSVSGVRRAVLQAVESATSAAPLRVLRREAAPDGFVKYLFELDGGAQVEAVRIPLPCEAPGADASAYAGKEKKYIVCVSSQAGCALACAFCATGRLGFQRNLLAHEIVGQVLAVRAEADRPVRGVVFMGMGEPLLNYDQVVAAARILNHPCGGSIDARLARLLDPRLVKLDLIDVNGEVGGFRRSTREGRSAFLDVLARSGMPFAIRYSGGQEIAAGCGQLAASNDRKGSRVV